jgi:beta-ribofuranosylaminobenzene 5'-phosphate synthase
METIRTPSRLHLGLIDMEGGLGRVDGGVGIALDEPGFRIAFERAEGVICSEIPARKIAEKVCDALKVPGIRIGVKETIPEHVGFGSKTQLSLAIAAGILKAYDIYKPVVDIAKLVGRGGTSGIGVAAFENGGFIVDGGHSSDKGFAPSGFSDASPPPVLARYDFPWWLVCAWPDVKGAHGGVEKGVFDKHCPIPAAEVGEVSRIILMKMLPSLVGKDIDEFGKAVNLLQKVGFKKVEIGLKESEIGELLGYLRENSAGAGMSSFGPVCFGVCEREIDTMGLERGIKSEFGCNVIATKANNGGARWL